MQWVKWGECKGRNSRHSLKLHPPLYSVLAKRNSSLNENDDLRTVKALLALAPSHEYVPSLPLALAPSHGYYVLSRSTPSRGALVPSLPLALAPSHDYVTSLPLALAPSHSQVPIA